MEKPSLALIPSGYKAGKVYSILPNDSVGDFTFTRNSGATRINKDGLIENVGETLSDELVTNGGFNTNSNWTVTGEDGTHIATFNNSLRYQSDTTSPVLSVNQDLVFEVGKTYKIKTEISDITSGYVKTDAFGASNNLNASIGTNIIYGVATSTTLNILRGTTNVDVTIDSISVKEVLTEVNTPRLDYSDGGCPSLLLEPSRTNYVPNQNVNSYGQNLADVTLSNNPSPDGTINCFRVEGTSSGLRVGIATFNVVIGNTYTGSVYVRKVSGSDTAQIVDVDFAAPQTINITTEWQRFDITRTATQTTGRIFVNVNQVGDVIEVFGFQIEEGSYATSYIPTNGSISTRAAELCVDGGNSDVFNDDEGVLFVETKSFADLGEANRYMIISDGASTPYTNHIIFQYRTDGDFRVYLGGVASSNIAFIVSSIDLSENHKIAFQYKLNDNKLFIDGVEQSPYAPFVETTLSGLNDLSFSLNNSNNFIWRASVKDLRYYDTELTDAELTELTTL